MKKILIFYASYGGGHLNAAKSIEEYFIKNYPDVETKLIDCMKYVNVVLEKITTTAYKEMAKKMPWAWGKIYEDSQKGPLAHISSRSNKIMAIKLLKLLKSELPDFIISTHPFGSQMCSYLKRKGKISSGLATIMTDFAPHDQWIVGSDYTDLFFVAHNKMKDYLISKNIPESKVFVTGIPISSRFLIDFSKKSILDELGFSENRKTVLFFGGGEYGLGKNRTLEIFESLITYFDNLQVIAISGKNPKMKEGFLALEKKANKTCTIKVLEYTNKVPEFMSISDFVITKPGGLTTSESLASSLPMVIINPIPGQEEENAQFLEDTGVGIWIRKNSSPKEVFESILNDPNKLLKMKEKTFILSKRNSTSDICKIINRF